MLKKSPSGSLCPYYYMGGELHPLKYGSFANDKEALFKIIAEEEKFILSSAGENNRRIWIDLYETVIDSDVLDELVRHLSVIKIKINKICLVGCNYLCRQRFIRRLKRVDKELAYRIRFFSEPEDAKMWLLGKNKE